MTNNPENPGTSFKKNPGISSFEIFRLASLIHTYSYNVDCTVDSHLLLYKNFYFLQVSYAARNFLLKFYLFSACAVLSVIVIVAKVFLIFIFFSYFTKPIQMYLSSSSHLSLLLMDE